MSARGGARAFPPACAEHELPAPFERKRKEEKLGCNSSASGRWARGRGAAERGGSGTAATPAPPPPPAPDRPRRARRERRPHRREQSASLLARRCRPARGRPPGEVGPRRGKCAGRRVGRGRREHAVPGASGAQPGRPPARSCEPGAWGSRGSPAAPKYARRRKGAGPRRAREARRGGDPTLLSWPGQRRRRLHNSDSNPPKATRLPHPRARRGGGVPRRPPRRPGCALPPQRSRVRSVSSGGGRRPSGQRGEEGGRRGTRCLFGSHPGLSSLGVRGRGHPVGCGAGLGVRSGPARPGGGGRRAADPGQEGGVGRLRGKSRRPRAAIITEPPFSEWLCLEEPGAVGAHPKLPAGRPLCERPSRAGGAGSAPARGSDGFPGGHF